MRRVFKALDRALLALIVVLLAFVAYVTVNSRSLVHDVWDAAVLVIVPTAVAVALIGTFRLGQQLRANLVLLLAFSGGALYAAETFLSFDPFRLLGHRPAHGFDQREPAEVVLALQSEGQEAHPVVPPETWLDPPLSVDGVATMPLAGVPHSTAVMCNEAGGYITYVSDRHGFNGPDGVWDMPVRVALVGDSFVQGWCVPREDSFAGLVRASVPVTLNVGYAGHGPLAELGAIREYVAGYEPGDVFWFFYEGNDLVQDLPREVKSPILRRYLKPGFDQGLKHRSPQLRRVMRQRLDERFAGWQPQPPDRSLVGRLVGIAKLRTLRSLTGIGVRGEESTAADPSEGTRDHFAQILAEAQRTVQAWGGTLHFVYLPDLPSALGDQPPAEHDHVIQAAEGLGLPVIDALPHFRDHPDPRALFPYDEGRHLVTTRGLHYDADGHELVARLVLAVLE